MKIQPSSGSYKSNNHNPSFKAGKVIFFNPFPQVPLHLDGAKPVDVWQLYCDNKKFVEANNIEHIALDARRVNEFDFNNYPRICSKAVLASDGCDVFEYSSESEMPRFPYRKTDKILNWEKDIIVKTNWEPEMIISKCKELIEKEGYIVSDSRLTNKDTVLVKKSDLRIDFYYPYTDSFSFSKPEKIIDIHKKAKEFFEAKGIKASIFDTRERSPIDGSYSIKKISVVPEIEESPDKRLSRSYFIKQAIEKAKQNNDLVVYNSQFSYGGNAWNPFTYISDYTDPTSDDYVRKNYSKLKNTPEKLIKLLKENPKKYKDILKEYNELPFISNYFLYGKNHKLVSFSECAADLNCVLLLKEAMLKYSKLNKSFKDALPDTTLKILKKYQFEKSKPQIIKGCIAAALLIFAGSLLPSLLKSKEGKNENK